MPTEHDLMEAAIRRSICDTAASGKPITIREHYDYPDIRRACDCLPVNVSSWQHFLTTWGLMERRGEIVFNESTQLWGVSDAN